jgi:CTP:molybdopterin cytidylyltransferase MocA
VQAAKAQEQLHTQIRNLKVEIAEQAAEHALLLLEKDRAVADCKAHCVQCLQSFAAAQAASSAAALTAAISAVNGDSPPTAPASKKRKAGAAAQTGTIIYCATSLCTASM